MMGKKFIIDKIMSGLVGLFSTVVMLFAIMFAIVRETRWPVLIVAALTCPLWHWLLRKYILKDKLLPLWLIRGGAILAGCIFFVYASAWFPFYSCMDVMIEDRMKTQYEEIIKIWKKEWMTDRNNPQYDDERKLLSRMEDADKEQILYFLKDFKVPATNNQVETDQRNIKIKQKIGKFRSETGARIYAIIRSCINTYKKHGINVYRAFIKSFNNETVIA